VLTEGVDNRAMSPGLPGQDQNFAAFFLQHVARENAKGRILLCELSHSQQKPTVPQR
jgi:hypothetical protein